MRVLMLGWEFPPFISGGLGTACHGLTRAMNRQGVDVLFVLPKDVGTVPPDVAARLGARGALGYTVAPLRESAPAGGRLTLKAVPARLPNPYEASRSASAHARPASWRARPLAWGKTEAGGASLRLLGAGAEGGYEGDLIGKIQKYADRCVRLTQDEPFDVIHAHDWITFPAGRALAARSGKPLITHVHSTEFDRSGEHVHPPVYEIERTGMHAAAAVLSVSHLTRRIVVERYGVPPDKVETVHNGIEHDPDEPVPVRPDRPEKVVLFLGRITMQKGPEYFVTAASRVLEKRVDVKFVMAGWGDLAPRIVEQVAAMGLGRQILFTGFLSGPEVDRAFRLADVYVMPSVSEPFGLTALEAIRCGTPVILSKNSGVAEVLRRGSLQVDFWDVQRMADLILSVLKHADLAETLRQQAREEIRGLTWDETARRCIQAYQRTVGLAAELFEPTVEEPYETVSQDAG